MAETKVLSDEMARALKAELLELVAEENVARRRLATLCRVTTAFEEIGYTPVLVGGAALEYYSGGGYATKDLDLGLPTGPDIDRVFAQLGFSHEGRYWFREDLDVLIEAPAPPGVPDAESARTVIEMQGHRAVLIGVEDVLLDRLRAAVHWHSKEDRRWAARLVGLYLERLDFSYLEAKTAAVAEEAELLVRLRREEGATRNG